MTYKTNTPTFNSGNRKVVNFKDFIQHDEEEKEELKDIKKNFTKNDKEIGLQQHKYKFNKVTHKMDDLVEDEVDDKLEVFESSNIEELDYYYELTPLTIEEFSNLREAMHAVKKSESPSAFRAKEFFSDDENFDKVVQKLRALLTFKD